MSGGPKQRIRRLFALGGAVCLPLAALVWSSPASAATLPVAISVDSSVNPSLFGQGVVYTATLTTSDGGSLDPGDWMEFQDNGNDIVNCNSQPLMNTGPGTYAATCDEPTNSLPIGDHSIQANFYGDSTLCSRYSGRCPFRRSTRPTRPPPSPLRRPEPPSPTATSHSSLST